MIIELGESIIDLGNHKSSCKNHLKPKNSGCTQEGDCSCKGNIGNKIETITQIESSLIPNLIFKVFPKAKVEYLKQFNNYEEDSVTLFNYLKAGENKPVPSEAVDEIWHNMILYTARYGHFCRKYFGRFVHHTPNDKKILAEDQPNCNGSNCGLEPCSCWCNPDGQGKCKNGR